MINFLTAFIAAIKFFLSHIIALLLHILCTAAECRFQLHTAVYCRWCNHRCVGTAIRQTIMTS